MKISALIGCSLVVLASFFVGCTTTDQYDIRPAAAEDGIPTAVDWQNQNDAKLSAAMKPDVLVSFVASDAAADGLLAQLKGAYATDPIVMTQIAGVSQLVLCKRCEKASAGRQIWIAALERARAKTADDYVRTFCDQQLRICK